MGYKFCQSCGTPPVAALGESSSMAKRIFLFSDGQANQGLRSRSDFAALAEEINGACLPSPPLSFCASLASSLLPGAGACISTFGIGKDFAEDIMTDIARSGAGNFCFIENSKRIVVR